MLFEEKNKIKDRTKRGRVEEVNDLYRGRLRWLWRRVRVADDLCSRLVNQPAGGAIVLVIIVDNYYY